MHNEGINWRNVCQHFMDLACSKSREYRMFKQAVRKYVDNETYSKISDEYNRTVTEYRKGRA
jgi:hypothetical protein